MEEILSIIDNFTTTKIVYNNDMIVVQRFVFNAFGVNTYVISGKSRECIIVDPACSNPREEQELSSYIHENQLTPMMLVNTHYHVDHILGNVFVADKYNLKPIAHADGKLFWETAREFGSVFGLDLKEVRKPGIFVKEGDMLIASDVQLRVVYTPGHAAGSISLVNDPQNFVITGDVLFQGSIGRTDLPTGDYDLLRESITEKLFMLPPDCTVYPGHGPQTTIGFERLNNPFL
ncbi:MAG: MBL fold metallo-hydrolase [Bacteroidales bacterium]|nr:MBL fold metallo-hydrolase [Bacteroidales bacterium]